MLNRNLVEQIANVLGARPDLVEKDWHVVRALSALAALEHEGSSPAFSGGTSLLKGWGLIKRFSEDIDFKVAMAPGASGARSENAEVRSENRCRRLCARRKVAEAAARGEERPVARRGWDT